MELHVTQLFSSNVRPAGHLHRHTYELLACSQCQVPQEAITYSVMASPDMSRVPPEVQERIRELEQELNEGGWYVI